MVNIQTLNKISPAGLERLPAEKYNCADKAESPAGILVRSADMHSLALPESLLCIARAGAGVNNIPLQKCSEMGVVVFNTPGANSNAVKELVIAGLLLSARRIVDGVEWVQGLDPASDVAKQVEAGKSAFGGPEIAGKTLGVVGLGAIGVMVANAAHHLDMNVVGFDPYISVDAAWGLSRSVRKASSLDELISCADFISLHVPLNDETRGMINAQSIAKMKPGTRLLNFSRGELVNNADIADALDRGHIGFYVTDFPTGECVKFKNTLCIPHLGASTPESEDNCARMAAEQMRDYIEHGNIRNSVNFPDVSAPVTNCRRVCVIHKNVPAMLSRISAAFGELGINIEHLYNKSRGDMAYTMVDVAGDIPPAVTAAIEAFEPVIKIRVL